MCATTCCGTTICVLGVAVQHYLPRSNTRACCWAEQQEPCQILIASLPTSLLRIPTNINGLESACTMQAKTEYYQTTPCKKVIRPFDEVQPPLNSRHTANKYSLLMCSMAAEWSPAWPWGPGAPRRHLFQQRATAHRAPTTFRWWPFTDQPHATATDDPHSTHAG